MNSLHQKNTTGKKERESRKTLLLIIFILSVAAFLNLKFAYEPTGTDKKSSDLSEAATSKLPPALTITTIALGPLRGIIANALWWRTIEQQDAGNYFEIIQLADWITALQPENPRVWTYQAWNMAYNVAYEFPDGESKWKWIFKAYKLLALDAVKYHPNSYEIKRETARIFIDRIGSTVDPGAPVFQKKWAALIFKYLPTGDRNEIERLAIAPKNLEELKRNPETRKFLSEAEKISFKVLDRKIFYFPQDWTETQMNFANKNESKRQMAILDSYYKAKELRDELGLEPSKMLFIDEQFGPFDWRLWQAYAVYFAAEGDFKNFLESPEHKQVMIRQSITASFLDGRLLFDPNHGIFLKSPNFKIVGRLHDYYDYMMEHNYSPRIDALHKDFLERSIAILYTYNQIEAAKELFEHYQEGYPEAKDLDFESYLAKSLFKTLHNASSMTRKAIVESSLVQAYNWLAAGETQRAIGYANFAKMIWKNTQAKAQGNPAFMLPPLEELMRSALNQVINSDIAPVFKKKLQSSLEAKEFELSTEKADTGGIFKKSNVYSKRTGEKFEGKASIENYTEE